MYDTITTHLLTKADDPTGIRLVKSEEFDEWCATLPEAAQTWLARQDFTAKPKQVAWLEDHANSFVVVGWDGSNNLNTLGHLPMSLPEGEYCMDTPVSDLQLVGWGLGAYQFTRYKNAKRTPAQLLLPGAESDSNNPAKIIATVQATCLSRDLINTSAADLAPSHLLAEALALADEFDATCEATVGDELLDKDCGAIHAVGRAALDPPCLIDLTWGDESHPKVTLVGKGITFDSGGLNLKSAAGMRYMKKDMGGAAIAFGLAYLIMSQKLPVRLRMLLPCAENAVAGNAFRPGDVLHTHKGLTVEIDNTDAEGRLVLCDALSIANLDNPEIIFDFATLTGSARSAVGTEIAAMFCNDDQVADALSGFGRDQDDAVWRMPLHPGYEHMIDSKIADIVNSAASPYAGSITAALFLQRFIDDVTWVHFDVMAFNPRSRTAHPEGGEAMAQRAVYAYLEERYAAT